MCSDCKPPRIRRQSRGVSRVASLVVAHSSSPTYGSATTRGTRAAAQQLIDQRTFARTQDQPSCQKQTWSSRPLKESRLVVMRAGWSAPYARHNKKMVLGLVPPFDHCAETDFVQRIASPGDSTRKSIHDHADKKTNRRERNTIRTNIAGQRTTSARDQVGKPKRPLQRRPRWPRGAQGVLSTRAANGWRGYPQGTVRKLTGTRPRPRCVPTKLCVTPNAK